MTRFWLSPTPTERQYAHSYAYCLAWFSCSCGHREQIWNSRDGAVSATMACPSCGKHTLHLLSTGPIVRVVDYVPNPGQRYIRDATADEWKQLKPVYPDTTLSIVDVWSVKPLAEQSKLSK